MGSSAHPWVVWSSIVACTKVRQEISYDRTGKGNQSSKMPQSNAMRLYHNTTNGQDASNRDNNGQRDQSWQKTDEEMRSIDTSAFGISYHIPGGGVVHPHQNRRTFVDFASADEKTVLFSQQRFLFPLTKCSSSQRNDAKETITRCNITNPRSIIISVASQPSKHVCSSPCSISCIKF